MLSLVTPYTAEEMWSRLGHEPSVALAGWPTVDPELLVEDVVTCIVQVAGKLRAKLEVSPSIAEAELGDAGAGRRKRGARTRRTGGAQTRHSSAEAGQRGPGVTTSPGSGVACRR